MTVPEQIAKVATSAIDGLKTNPNCLAALAVVSLFLVLQYFDNENQSQRMMKRADDVMELLNRCYPDEGRP